MFEYLTLDPTLQQDFPLQTIIRVFVSEEWCTTSQQARCTLTLPVPAACPRCPPHPPLRRPAPPPRHPLHPPLRTPAACHSASAGAPLGTSTASTVQPTTTGMYSPLPLPKLRLYHFPLYFSTAKCFSNQFTLMS